jgi:hypothetical protein
MFVSLVDKFIATLASLVAFAGTLYGSTFYVDVLSGDDGKLGTSPSLAWSSLAPVSQHRFKADDRILALDGR